MSTIFTLEKLWRAYEDCQKRKKNTVNALKFELNREKNLVKLLDDLKSHRYKISRHICFIVTVPTPREIFAADFRDRIVHHLLYRELYKMVDADLIADSYANRQGKGTHAAVYQIQKFIKEVKIETGGGFYLKLDVQGFFRSIDRKILFKILEDKLLKKVPGYIFDSNHDDVWLQDVFWLLRKIIFNDPTKDFIYKGNPALQKLIPPNKSLFYSAGRGLPIGNLTSQFFANIYLNELDQFITKKLGFSRYLRYVDDFVIVSHDKVKLRSFIKPIDDFLQEHLSLKLHPHKICLQPVSSGIDYLGYFIKPTYKLVRQKVVKRFKKKLHKISFAKRLSPDQIEEMLPMINSYYGHFSHAESHNLRATLFNDHMIKLKEGIIFNDDYNSASLKK
jgi:RNA-directed DNA polymerase